MYVIVANDFRKFEFTKEEIRLIPFAHDAFDDGESYHELPALFSTHKQLELLKDALKASDYGKVSFNPTHTTLWIGELKLHPIIFTNLVWDSETLDKFFKTLKTEDLIDLLKVADDMCCWDLRNACLSLLFMYYIRGFIPKSTLENLHPKFHVILSNLTIAAHNDCCDHQDSSVPA